MTSVVIIVYNRLENLKLWFDCWNLCDKTNAKLVVIHNYDHIRDTLSNESIPDGIIYIPRRNVGLDIGAFQDVCRGRLNGFPEYDKLLWITDDTIPMKRNFVSLFESAYKPGIGCACMEITALRAPMHVRTTGFMISKEVAKKLKFPVDPIINKQQCYQFEHRGSETLYSQINKMGLKSVMVDIATRSPLWDIGNRLHFNRMAEHNREFSIPAAGKKVLFICPMFNNYPQIISALMCQTHHNWELWLIHDGPGTNPKCEDSRVKYMETAKHQGNWGHYIRRDYLQKEHDADFVVITNADNYYVPSFCEAMIAGFGFNNVATYCAKMVHSYVKWGILECRLSRGYLDCGGVMVRADVANEIGWRDIESHSSDWIYFADIIQKYGAARWSKIPGCLFTHN